jgi:hypothetical protein
VTDLERARTLATTFAQHLVDGKPAAAHKLLAPSLAAILTTAALAEEWTTMSTEGDPFTNIGIDAELEDWPDRKPDHVVWLYVGVFGTAHVEAVTVTIAKLGRKLVIDSVEWGRP